MRKEVVEILRCIHIVLSKTQRAAPWPLHCRKSAGMASLEAFCQPIRLKMLDRPPKSVEHSIARRCTS
jgi:hypothetical protein